MRTPAIVATVRRPVREGCPEQHLFAATFLLEEADVAGAAAEAVGALRTRIELATPPPR